MKKTEKSSRRVLAAFVALLLCLGTVRMPGIVVKAADAKTESGTKAQEGKKDSDVSAQGAEGNSKSSVDSVDAKENGSGAAAKPEEDIAAAGEDTENKENHEIKALSEDPDEDGTEKSEKNQGITLYISKDVSNEKEADGTKNKPFASLSEAVRALNGRTERDFTIVLLTDVTASACARINSKNVTIKGNGHTVTRAGQFDTISDNARSWYNPAMIEVCDPSHSIKASLRLEDVILDDNKQTAGTKYSQAAANSQAGNGDIVQDGIIATYDGVGSIILGKGAVLKGYGGMSAVRLSAGTLTMESGSKITGSKTFATKGGGNGPAGAVWIQGGSFIMDKGAEITDVAGRGIYLDGDGSKAVINGLISDITANNNMWQGTAGVAVHARNKSGVILGSEGRITGIEGSKGGESALYVNASNFMAEQGSVISDTKNIQAAYIEWAGLDNDPYEVWFNGTVERCSYTDVLFRAFCARYTIGAAGEIKDTTATASKIGVFYLLNGGQADVRGKITDNNNKGIYMANQTGADTYVWVKEGAYIHKNSGYGIYANNGGHVIMDGGEISENSSYGIYIRSKDSYPRGTLDMTGGKIINNGSAGVCYETCGKVAESYVNVIGGEISGNGSSYGNYQISVTGANAADDISRVYMKTGVVKEAENRPININTSFATLNFDSAYTDTYLGTAKTNSSGKLKELVKGYKQNDEDINEYVTKGNYALWFKSPEKTFEFATSRAAAINKALPLYVAYIPLKTDGTPMDDVKMSVERVDNEDKVKVDLANLIQDQPYALMWMQPTEKYGTLTVDGTNEIQEVSGEIDYEAAYNVEYTLTKDIACLMKAGDLLTVNIKLDDRLTYRPGNEDEKIAVKIDSSDDFFGLDRTEYDDTTKTLTAVLKLKEGFPTDKSSKVMLSFKGRTALTAFPAEETILSTDAVLEGKVKLSGETEESEFKVETPAACKTKLIPEVPVDPEQPVIPIPIPTPTPESSTPSTPSTPSAPQAAPAAADAPAVRAAVRAAAPSTAPAASVTAIDDEEVPLANGGDDVQEETVQNIPDEKVPEALTETDSWALLNLLLMLVTVAMGIWMLLNELNKKDNIEEDDEFDGGETSSRRNFKRVLSLIPASVSVLVFFFTENMTAKMVTVDRMTFIMLLITAVQMALFTVTGYRYYDRKQA